MWGMAAHFCDPSTAEAEMTVGTLGTTGQRIQLKWWAPASVRDPVSKNVRWRTLEEGTWCGRLASICTRTCEHTSHIYVFIYVRHTGRKKDKIKREYHNQSRRELSSHRNPAWHQHRSASPWGKLRLRHEIRWLLSHDTWQLSPVMPHY